MKEFPRFIDWTTPNQTDAKTTLNIHKIHTMSSKCYQNLLAEMRMIGAENTHHVGIYLENKHQIYLRQIGSRITKEEANMLLEEFHKFKQCRKNIEHAAANLIQNYLLNRSDDYSDYSTDSNIEAAKQAEELYLSGWKDPYKKWSTEECEEEPYLSDSGKW